MPTPAEKKITSGQPGTPTPGRGERYFHTAIDTVPAIIWITEKDGTASYFNKRWYDITGQTPAEAIGFGWLNAVHPDDREKAGKIFLDANETSAPFTILYRLRHANGEYRWSHDNGEPRLDADGKFVGYIGSVVDVHEEKVAEERTRKSEEQLQLVTDAMPSLISYIDNTICYQFNNKSYEEWFGIARGTLRGKPMKEVLGEKAYATLEPYIKRALSGETVTFESRVAYKAGEKIIMGTYVPHIDRHNTVLGFYVLVNDVTESRNAETRIRESEEKNRLFIEHAPAAMAMFDKEMRYLSVSKQWIEEYGLTGDIIGKKHYDLFPNMVPYWKEVHQRSLQGSVERAEEDFYITRQGKPVWLSWEVHPWYTNTEEIGGIVIFTENITARKKAEEKIRESEERFRTMASEAPLFVWVTDETLQTTFLNKTGLQYFGVEEAIDMKTLSWKKFIHPDDLQRVLETMKAAAANHETYTLEMRLKNGQTGQYRWFLDKGAPRYNGDIFTGFIGTSMDIQDRKEAEELLALKDAQKNNFIAMASHELKTPITSIKGYVQLLLKAMEKENESKPLSPLLIRSSLLSVDKQVNRLTRLISELLDISKIEAGTLELKPEVFSINELAIEMVEDTLYTNASHQVELHHEYKGYVYGDRDRIGQVMLNLLSNAIKYSPGQTTIDVTIHQPAAHTIAISVKDQGIGIPEKDLDMIFEKFYRVEGKTEQTFPGFGIGLFVAKQFIEKQGGHISVTSTKDKGSVFTFTLPLTTPS